MSRFPLHCPQTPDVLVDFFSLVSTSLQLKKKKKQSTLICFAVHLFPALVTSDPALLLLMVLCKERMAPALLLQLCLFH